MYDISYSPAGGGGLVTKSCPTLATPWTEEPGSPWDSPSKNTEVGAISFSRDLPTQELNPGLLHCRQILHQLSYKRSPCKA